MADDNKQGRKLLTAVERLVAPSAELREVAQQCREAARQAAPRDEAAKEAVRRYSNKAALAGAASNLPSLIPGAGLVTAIGATLAEFAVLLKLEVEMTLVLLDLFGFDIEDPQERQLGFVLASVGTYDASTRSNFLVDVAKVESQAVWNYGPRRIGKILVEVMAVLVGVKLWRGVFKLMPVIGLVAGTSINKVLTTRVGTRVRNDLKTRLELQKSRAAVRPGRRKSPARKRSSAVHVDGY
ncbi:MAG: EcsC family protein [Myxococcales bacterium]